MKQDDNFDELTFDRSHSPFQSTNSSANTSNSKYWFSHLKVAQKIGIGYGLVLSIAVLGTSIGFLIADYDQRQAQNREEAAIEELYQMYQLKTIVFRVRTNQHKLILYMEQPTRWGEQYTLLLKYVEQARQVWFEFKASYSNENNTIYDSVIEQEAVDRLLQNYKDFDVYLQRTEALFRDKNPSQLSAREIKIAQTQLFNLMHGSSVFMIDDFLDDITNLVEVISEEYQQANWELEKAEKLRLYIILGSLSLSIAIATLLAIYTSGTIARPIQAVTHVAQQVTEQSNFDLQAPVTTNDEVGILAASLNRLIQEVQQLIKVQNNANEQLEVYSQVLEEKVRERTQELNEKNLSLELALDELRRTQAQLVETEQKGEKN
ncbi:HAMP domain-containing protein [Nodularia sp. NIES-3585]|uniref:HAMP domain-containing protein n=1 Tax=Nodularia sp. NIES-3585 TaxID=1973477 RepID=UPI000B5CBC6B|nr:HAMP domain-containing protein [Nodularia sp. NIES-3585]GAX37727.1 integral membrane sensor signal transduction histidine kinase [Nodularia sp. NIES-3585]